MQKEVLGFLRKQTYDENNKITSLDEKGNPTYKNEILADNKIDKNLKDEQKKALKERIEERKNLIDK